MTVEVNDCIERYTISGTGPYPFSFRIYEDSDIAATALESGDVDPVTLTLNTDYTVTGANDEDGGSVTLSSGAASSYSGYTLDMRSNTPLEQPTSIKNQGTFAPVVHEKALDRLSRQIQDVYRQLKQAWRYPDNVNLDAKMTSRSAWLGKWPYVNDDGEIEPSVLSGQAMTQSTIGELLYPQTAAEIAAGVTPVNYYLEPGVFERYGDTSTDATAAITAACKVAGVRARPRWPFSTYTIGAVIIDSNARPILDLSNTKLTLSGDGAGIYYKGTITSIRHFGGEFIGDGTNRDAASDSSLQVAVSAGNYAGDTIDDVLIEYPISHSCTVGVRVAYGTSPNRVVNRCIVRDPQIFDSVGYTGGRGYGVQFTQAPGSIVQGGYISGCQRHGLYFSEGKNYRAVGVEITGCGKNDGTIRGAISTSRSGNVELIGMMVHDNNDVGLACDTDAQGISPNTNTEVNVIGGVWKDNKYGDIIVGTSSNPAVDGVPHNVNIVGVTMKAPSSPNASLVTVNQCDKLTMTGNVLDASAPTSGSLRLVSINGTGGAAYSDRIKIKRNTLLGGGGATLYGFQVASSLCTGTQKIDLRDNDFDSITNEFEFLSGEDSVTNNNLLYNRQQGGGGVRTYSSSGSTITIAVGGLDRLIMSASGATTVSQFTGAVEGQTLVIYFTNGNSTIKATNFYLAGAADFVGTASDTLTLRYLNGSWIEVSRSVN